MLCFARARINRAYNYAVWKHTPDCRRSLTSHGSVGLHRQRIWYISIQYAVEKHRVNAISAHIGCAIPFKCPPTKGVDLQRHCVHSAMQTAHNATDLNGQCSDGFLNPIQSPTQCCRRAGQNRRNTRDLCVCEKGFVCVRCVCVTAFRTINGRDVFLQLPTENDCKCSVPHCVRCACIN